MTIKSVGQALLKKHTGLFPKLIQIPEKREMKYQVVLDNGETIGKPRFKKKEYTWPKKLLIELRDHLQGLWNYFQLYSYWLDNAVLLLLDYRTRRASKKSVIFLLEMDVWNTDEVFGDYLINKRDDKTELYYTRFGQRFRKMVINSIEDDEIKDWICKDAVQQIQDQFSHLWNKLETELQACMEEKFRKPPKISVSLDYIREQIERIEEEIDEWPESALLNLGRCIEIWLIIELEIMVNNGLDFLIKEAEIKGLIDKHQFQLLMNIKNHYNQVKHYATYKVNNKTVHILYNDFCSIFK